MYKVGDIIEPKNLEGKWRIIFVGDYLVEMVSVDDPKCLAYEWINYL